MWKFVLVVALCVSGAFAQEEQKQSGKDFFGVSIHSGHGKNYVSGDSYPVDYWYAFNDGPDNADDSKPFLTKAGSQYIAIYFDFNFGKIYSFGIETRKRKDIHYKTKVWEGSNGFWWRGHAGIEDPVWYWFKVTYPYPGVDLGKAGKISSSFDFQFGYSPETVMVLHSEDMQYDNIQPTEFQKGKWTFDFGLGFLLDVSMEYETPIIPLCIGATIQGGFKGPEFNKCVYEYSNSSGSYIQKRSDNARGKFGAPLYWGFDFYLRYQIPLGRIKSKI
ncbi:MAG: hypothetical protein WC703_10860 [Candidatus Neomarinimicrobiota bacterium]